MGGSHFVEIIVQLVAKTENLPVKKTERVLSEEKKQKGKIFEPSHTLDGDSSLHHKQGFGCSQFTKE